MLKTYEAGPPVSEATVHAFETKYSIKRPGSYRDFLLASNGGRPELDLDPIPGLTEDPVPRLHFFFGLNDPIESCNLDWNRDVFSDRIPLELLLIGTTEGADKLCLSLRSGEINHWDGNEGTFYPVARSFDEFVSILSRDELSPTELGADS
jgi:hypothetical protein